ncbi:hypothetical protein HHI36_016742 [Cryptolaemus montrouzieri]|uniref:Neurogenic mastermind-like N-terminal domain-containing protein n=1 Tax=Cryptolaemus montrouzieri TaxID=559131 RepID=A0ABD2NL26_9CUCU
MNRTTLIILQKQFYIITKLVQRLCEQNLQDTLQLKQRYLDAKAKRPPKAKDKKQPDQTGSQQQPASIQSSVHVLELLKTYVQKSCSIFPTYSIISYLFYGIILIFWTWTLLSKEDSRNKPKLETLVTVRLHVSETMRSRNFAFDEFIIV